MLPTFFSRKALENVASPSTLTVVVRLLDSSVLSLSLKKLRTSSQVANKWLSLQKQKSTKS